MSNSSGHDERYKHLQFVRENWRTQAYRTSTDHSGRVICIDGRLCVDIPSFYLCLGYAVNGPDGYYGASLDALEDCLCGGFGLVPPFTLVVQNAAELRNNLGHDAESNWRQSCDAEIYADPDILESDLTNLGRPAPPIQPDASHYFDAILQILKDHQVSVVFESPDG